jgi:hypothetical protein
VDPRAGMDDVEKRKFLTLPGLELRSLRRAARSQSLSRLIETGLYATIVFSHSCLCFRSDAFPSDFSVLISLLCHAFYIPRPHHPLDLIILISGEACKL